MVEFSYRASGPNGEIDSGRIIASGRDDALRQLRGRGLVPLRLEDPPAGESERALASEYVPAPLQVRKRWRSYKVTANDIVHVTGELSVMLSAGLPLDRALKVLIGMSPNPALVEVLNDVLKDVKAGKGLSQALAPRRPLFGDFYISMVRSGEAGGQLAQVLERLAEHLERMKELRESIISALVYPAILLVVAVLSVALMLGFVVPQFEALFDDMGESLPLITQLVVDLGRFAAEWGGLVLAGVVLLIWSARRWMRTEEGREWVDGFVLRMPLFGEILRKYEVTRFARGMGTLLSNGVPIVTAVSIGAEVIGNGRLRKAVAGVIPKIKQGGRFAVALEASGVLTPLASNMVRLGEETGRLDRMLLEIARVHDREVQAGVKRGLTLVEPILILLLGAAIAVIIVAILMGILSLNEIAI